MFKVNKMITIMLCFSFVLSCVLNLNGTMTAAADTREMNTNIGKGSYGMLDISYKKQKGAVYTWYSSNEKIVTVDNTALSLTGIKQGTTTITCKEDLNGKTKTIATYKVNVKNAEISSRDLLSSTLTTYTDYSRYTAIRIDYQNPNAAYSFKSSKPEIAAIDENGRIIEKTTGTTVITVKETLNKKEKVIGEVTVKVLDNKYSLNKELIKLFFDKSYTKSEQNSYIKKISYPIESEGYGKPAYSYQVEDTSICEVVNGDYLKPLKEGKTNLICTIIANGKSKVLGKIPIQVNKINEKTDYFLDGDKISVSLIEQRNCDISYLYKSNIPSSKMKFTSKDPSVVSIDSKTGLFRTIKPGETKIVVNGGGKEISILIKVLKEGSIPEIPDAFYEEYSWDLGAADKIREIYQEIDKLDLDEITADTLVECYKKANRIYNNIGLNTDWGGYSAFIDKYFISKFYKYIKKLREMDPLSRTGSPIQHTIKKVTKVSPKELEVELDIPFFDLEMVQMTYFDVEGDRSGMYSICTIIIDVNGFKAYRYGTLTLVPNTNILKVYLYDELPKGTHSIHYSVDGVDAIYKDNGSITWTKFTYK